MNNEQQQIIDEVYMNYKRLTHNKNEKDVNYGEYSKWGDNPLISGIQHLTKGSFIQMIKIDSDFSEKWCLTIEERELSELERMNIGKSKGMWKEFQFGNVHEPCNERGISTKLIIVTYQNKTITSYE
jgi:hypothetical protein